MWSFEARVVYAWLFMSLGGAAWAQAPAPAMPEPRGELSLAMAVELALARNAELAGFELKVAQAGVLQAGRRPNPTLGLEAENFAGSGAYNGAKALETTLSLGQVIELGGKRRLRSELAEAGVALTSVEQRAAQLDVLAEVTRRFVSVAEAQERQQFADQNVEVTRRAYEVISTRVTAARSPVMEGTRARIALTRSRIEAMQAQAELSSARHALAALWGSREPGFSEARAQLFELPELADRSDLLAAMENNPDLLRVATEARLLDAETRLARAQARPDLTLSVGVRSFADHGDAALVAGVSMPLAIFDRNQGNIESATTRKAKSQALGIAARLRLENTLLALHQELQVARERTALLRNEAIPLARAALEQTVAGYERGRFSYLELSSAQHELLDLQAASIDSAADFHRLLADLERLAGASLVLEATQP